MKSEESLKNELAHGSERAFDELFRLYHPVLCGYAYKMVLDRDEAKEIAQQCFVSLWERRAQADQILSVKSFLFRSAHNICLNKFKHQKIKDRYASEEEYFLQSCYVSEFENTFSEELGKQIKTAVEDLPEKNREVFKLRYFRGFDTQEVSEELGIAPRTVEAHVSAAFRFLRDRLRHLPEMIIILLISTF